MSIDNKLTIFISYATEDSDIADAIQKALADLSENVLSQIDIIQDKHSFELGRDLKEQIYDALERSTILFIIYTEALKKSHSYTGAEVGAFGLLMAQDIRKFGKTERRVVCLYLDSPPVTEPELLNVKLNKLALGVLDQASKLSQLDPGNGLIKFLKTVSDAAVERVFRNQNQGRDLNSSDQRNLQKQKDARYKFIDENIIGALKGALLSALSRIIENASIEQKMIMIKWKKSARDLLDQDDVFAGSELSIPNGANPDVFEIFGLSNDITSMEWKDFKSSLEDRHKRDAQFIINAFDNTVRSALRIGPVDNEQFFLSSGGTMFRIIITRHYGYYDGSRIMHVYFIPILPRFEKSDIMSALALLNIATRFRSLFIAPGGKLSPDAFVVNMHVPAKFKGMVVEFVRQFLLIEDESHVYGLDDPLQFIGPNANGQSAKEIADVFSQWALSRKAILASAQSIVSSPTGSEHFAEEAEKWIVELRGFCIKAETINRQFGGRAANILGKWFQGNVGGD